MGSNRGSQVGPSVADRQRFAEMERGRLRGESVKAYATRTGQSVHTLYAARKHVRRAAGGSRARSVPRVPRAHRGFVEALWSAEPDDASVVRSGAPVWRVRFSNGAILEGHDRLDGDALSRLVVELRAES